MNSRYLLIGGAVIIVLLGALIFLPRNSVKQEMQSQPTSQVAPTNSLPTQSEQVQGLQVAVEYTKEGFNPKTITVKKGTTVNWTNTTDSPMWVASDPHPAHTNLAGFDELSAVEKGGIYTYTFAKEGNWGYHNHLSPRDKGTVVVE